MHIDLTGKTAIVTGSTTGIGLATAKGLAIAGATVIVNGRKQEAVDKAVEQVEAAAKAATGKPPQLSGFAADLGTAEGCNALIAHRPTIDILVNNLGIFGPHDFFEIPDDEWERFFDVNILSGVRLSRAYLPDMAKRGWGRVIFLSSESALNIPADMIHYGVTKTALLSLSRGLAKRMSGTGVTVNAVLPGPTMSEGVAAMLKPDADAHHQSVEEAGVAFVKAHRPSSILQRPATVEEVANMIVYTCSVQASATTGAALRVDGGVVDSIV